MTEASTISQRFRGFLPVVVDVETGGFNAETDALLELAAIPLTMENGLLVPGENYHFHLEPFRGANIETAAIEFTGIDIHSPFRQAIDEADALEELFEQLRLLLKQHKCSRCILVGHNAWFDLSFLNAAIERNQIKKSPFHSFSSFDTATLAGMAYGQTVLAKACEVAKIDFKTSEAHSALYDTQKTSELFCKIINNYKMLVGEE
ncbi:MAG TPA: ribonuclease T [Aeromonadales bacterium]|nr:ribonuclease T [Aeromonadales bacterium]